MFVHGGGSHTAVSSKPVFSLDYYERGYCMSRKRVSFLYDNIMYGVRSFLYFFKQKIK